jgi:hypothetical protein
MESKAYDTPSDVSAEEGEVMLDGPGGIAVSLTPDAALETSHRLLTGGLEAQGQKVETRGRNKKD